MVVKVEVLPWLSELAGGTVSRKVVLEEELKDGASLRAVLLLLVEKHGRLGRMIFDPGRNDLTGHAEIAINGRLYDQAGGLDSALCPGDTVSILPGIAGGSGQCSSTCG